MSKLGQLLSYLERPEVTELVFRSGAPAVMQVGNRQHPITVTPLRMPQLRRFFDGTQVLGLLPSSGESSPKAHRVQIQGRPYRVTIRGNRSAVEIRMSKGGGSLEPPDEPPAPAQTRHPDAPEPRPASGAASQPASVPREPTPPDSVSLPHGGRLGPARGRGEASRGYPMRSRTAGLKIEPVPPEPATAPPLDMTIERNDDLGAAYHGGSPGDAGDSAAPPLDMTIERGGQEQSLRSPTAGRSPSVPHDMTLERGGQEQSRHRAPSPGLSPSPPHDLIPERGGQEQSRHRNVTPSRSPPPTVSNASAMPSLTANARHDPAPAPAPMPRPASPGAHPPPARPPPAAPPATPHPLSGPRVEARPGAPMHAALRQVLAAARQQGISDVHVMSGEPIRLRRCGDLSATGSRIPADEVKAMVEPLLQPRHAAQLAQLGYTDLAAEIPGAGRLRLNVNRQRTGLKICIRLVVDEPLSLDQLRLPAEVRKLTTHHQGMVLISGPNGHGKTTTMAAMVDLFNASKPLHIITVEDPVEVIHPRKQALMTQREVGTHTLSFSAALAGALREDPDVIAIGELRDRETVEMALSAAETGHLVLATMSTPSGAKTIDRVIDMFPPDDQSQVRATLSGALKLVISQRLLRRADGKGLVAAYEMITGNVPLWTLIRDNKLYQLPSLLQRGRNYGMIKLEDSLRELMSRGLVTEQEALLYADDPRALAAPPPTPTPSDPRGGGWRFGRGR